MTDNLPADPRLQQFGGIVLAIGKLVELLKAKGVVTEFEIDAVLESAETGPMVSFLDTDKAEPYRKQTLFPIRMLRLVNRTWGPGQTMPSNEEIRAFLEGRTHEL